MGFSNIEADGLWLLQDFVAGQLLIDTTWMGNYTVIGTLAAHFNSIFSDFDSKSLKNHIIDWAECLNCDLAETIPTKVRDIISSAPYDRATVIHGDLNFANIIVSGKHEHLYVIDFDNSGLGLPEQELALSLLYENTSSECFLKSRDDLIQSYKSTGGHLDLELLDAYIITAPIYAAIHAISKKKTTLLTTSIHLKEGCISQVNDRLNVINSFT